MAGISLLEGMEKDREMAFRRRRFTCTHSFKSLPYLNGSVGSRETAKRIMLEYVGSIIGHRRSKELERRNPTKSARSTRKEGVHDQFASQQPLEVEEPPERCYMSNLDGNPNEKGEGRRSKTKKPRKKIANAAEAAAIA